MSGFHGELKDKIPGENDVRLREIGEYLAQHYQKNGLNDKERMILRQELKGRGKPEIPPINTPYGDFLQRASDQLVQRVTETGQR